MTESPAKLKTVAVVQIVSGALNVFFLGWFTSMMLGGVAGALTAVVTLGICPIGVLCGLPPWLLIPLGILELVAGIMGLASPSQGSAKLAKIVSYVEVGSILLGGLLSCVAGVVNAMMVRDPEVQGYLEG